MRLPRRFLAGLTLLCAALLTSTPLATAVGSPRYPDLQTVVPKHLGIQNAQQRELLRFTNGFANRGDGPLRVRPARSLANTTDTTDAIQELLDLNGAVADSQTVGSFVYHPAHHHWHLTSVGLFEVRKARDDGRGGGWEAVVRNDGGVPQSVKVTFCLIDWYKLDDNSRTPERTFWDCDPAVQGISPGWVDQYHHELDGQAIDVTGLMVGIYYLVNTANPDRGFIESRYDNNTAWRSFRLERDSRGNAKVTEIASSACYTPGMCGEQRLNR